MKENKSLIIILSIFFVITEICVVFLNFFDDKLGFIFNKPILAMIIFGLLITIGIILFCKVKNIKLKTNSYKIILFFIIFILLFRIIYFSYIMYGVNKRNKFFDMFEENVKNVSSYKELFESLNPTDDEIDFIRKSEYTTIASYYSPLRNYVITYNIGNLEYKYAKFSILWFISDYSSNINIKYNNNVNVSGIIKQLKNFVYDENKNIILIYTFYTLFNIIGAIGIYIVLKNKNKQNY